MPEYHFSLLCFFVLIHTSIKQDPNSPSAQPTGLPDFTFQKFLILWWLLQNAKKFITFKLLQGYQQDNVKTKFRFWQCLWPQVSTHVQCKTNYSSIELISYCACYYNYYRVLKKTRTGRERVKCFKSN